MSDTFTKEDALRLYNLRKDTDHSNFEEWEFRIYYHFQSCDGSYSIPRTMEGNLLRFVIAEIEGRKPEKYEELRKKP